SSPGAGQTDGGETPATPTLTLSVTNAAGANTNNVSGNTPVTVQAILLAANNAAVVGQVVTFTTGAGVLTPVSGTVLTAAGGIAEIRLTAGTVEAAANISASVEFEGNTITSNTVGIQSDGLETISGSNVLKVSAVSLSTPDNSNAVGRDNIGIASVTVTDANGNGVNQAVVTFTTNVGLLSPASGAVSTGTNATGIATITVLAGTNAGGGQINASIVSGSETITAEPVPFISLGDAVATIGLSIPSGIPNTNVSNAAPVVVTATVIDAAGAPVLGAIVNFVNNGDGVLSTTTDITNVSGQATTNLLAGTTQGFGSISASTSVAGAALSSPADGAITFATDGDAAFQGVGSSNLGLTLTVRSAVNGADFFTNLTNGCVAANCKVDANNPAILQANLVDALGQPVADTIIQFSTNGIGDVFPINGLALTNSDGIASVSLNAGSVPGAGVATATVVIGNATFDTRSLNFATNGNAGDAVITLSSIFTDATPGNQTNTLTKEDSASVRITVQEGAVDLPLRTATITTTFNSNEVGTGVTVNLPGETPAQTIIALSDSEGAIEFVLATDANSGTGAITVVVGDTQLVINFEVSAAGLQIGTCSGGTSFSDCGAGTVFTAGTINIAETTVSAGGSTNIGLVIQDSGGAFVSDIDVTFGSGCSSAAIPLAKISDDAPNALGIVTGDYQADGCVGPDTVTATEASTGQTATGTVSVLPANIGAIVFSGVTDSNNVTTTDISIKESGGNSTAFVVFQVLDVFGAPAENENVLFSLTSTVGGIKLETASDITDENGFATAILEAGFIATTVRVRASLDVDRDDDGDKTDFDDIPEGATTLVTLSGNLSINSGIADQDSFTLAADNLNFQGGDLDGETVTFTVFLADQFNNPVDDTVQFTSEFGQIVSSCETVNGLCTVNLTSANPRGPLDTNLTQQNIFNACPSELIFDEVVIIDNATGAGDTFYTVNAINRVEKGILPELGAEDEILVLGTDYLVDADGSGITCVTDNCSGETNLRITYTRAFPDEDNSSDTTHLISAPGVATAPFRGRTGVPCRAGSTSQGGAISSGYLGGLGQLYGSRSTILAFAVGEESFIDTNGDGLYSFGEPFVDLTEAVVDYNEDSVFGNGDPTVDASRDLTSRNCYGPNSPLSPTTEVLGNCYQVGGDEDRFIDFNQNGQFDLGNGIYNGSLCEKSVSDRTEVCDNNTVPCVEATSQFCTRNLVSIRRQAVIIFSNTGSAFGLRSVNGEYINGVDLNIASGSYISASDELDNLAQTIAQGTAFTVGHADTQVAPQVGDTSTLTAGSGGVIIDVSDINNAHLAAGTVFNAASAAGGCLIGNTPGFTLGSTNSTAITSIFVSLIRDPALGSGSGPVEITAVAPNGEISSITFNCQF
ncbi:MAG: hypothetical protein KUG79_08030, partial [Pseudomonadales bacterium]|nr:hypothetical protein [Pseudomonadales bacterium]